MRVLVAPDKFKGSLSAAEVADNVGKGLREWGIDVLSMPLADGGDGSVTAALTAGFRPRACSVADAMGRRRSSCVALRGRTAVVEVANTCGMQTLPTGAHAPMLASSFGFGEAIAAVVQLGVRHVVLALGGSASTDGGLGMLAALGFQFFDAMGRRIAATAQNLPRIHRLRRHAGIDLTGVDVLIAGDVTNPLTGPRGAARVFGPQKGATPADIRFLEAGLDNLVDAVRRSGWRHADDLAASAGAGAAGGCGFAAMLLGGTVVSGADYFLDLLGFDEQLSQVDVVVTGEGRLDAQTLNGKLPAVVARRSAPTPVIAVVGRNDLVAGTQAFAEIHAVVDFTDSDPAVDAALTADILRRVGGRIGRRLRRMPHVTGADRREPTSVGGHELDRFDRELIGWLARWAPYGGPPEDELLSEFGMSRSRLIQRIQDILAVASSLELTAEDHHRLSLAGRLVHHVTPPDLR